MIGEWLIRGRDGRLSIYHVSSDAVLCRAELVPGGSWGAPRTVGGDQVVHPVLAVGQGADSYAHLVSWRPMGPGRSSLVHSVHFRPLLAALDWVDVGHPAGEGDRTSTPAVAVDGHGRAHVFVRGEDGGLSMRAQSQKGGWGPWHDLKGSDLQGGPVALTGAKGGMHAYAAGPGVLMHWHQTASGVVFGEMESVQAEARPGTLRALATSDENTSLFFTDPAGDLCVWRPGSEPVALLPAAGPGPVSAVRCRIDAHDCTLLAQRSSAGRVALAAYPSEQEGAGAWWTESGPQLSVDAEVSLALDAEDRVVAATLSPSAGRLLLSRLKDEPGLALGPWQQV
ncbi:hypothetical protein [Streptomyces lancefieldiae]|uniref:PLL-like beta propeller domain-containing protein n=1 Tax=Streptomyces lancefieldiae TaxID=3075520 RepID=A0ABU3AMV5_9ACTN|nr:hypothetical protein [Streptomyces sp. DSM 40712]MDT0611526.1 hypothetical protein [Streptomyces sp. DSM 40712]